jgi:hypothetical protein
VSFDSFLGGRFFVSEYNICNDKIGGTEQPWSHAEGQWIIFPLHLDSSPTTHVKCPFLFFDDRHNQINDCLMFLLESKCFLRRMCCQISYSFDPMKKCKKKPYKIQILKMQLTESTVYPITHYPFHRLWLPPGPVRTPLLSILHCIGIDPKFQTRTRPLSSLCCYCCEMRARGRFQDRFGTTVRDPS